MANLEVASRSLVFEMNFKKIDGDLYAKLVKNEFTFRISGRLSSREHRAPQRYTTNAANWHGTWGEDRRWWANGHR